MFGQNPGLPPQQGYQAPAPQPAPQQGYQAPAPQPAPQQSYQQAPAPAPQPGYQAQAPAPQPGYQPGYQAPQPGYQAPQPGYQAQAPAPQQGYQPGYQPGYQAPAPQQGLVGGFGSSGLFAGMASVQERGTYLAGGEYIVSIMDCSLSSARSTNQPVFRLYLRVVCCIADERGVPYGQPGYSGHAPGEEVTWAAVRNANANYHSYFLSDIKSLLSRIHKAYFLSLGREDETPTWSEAKWTEETNKACGLLSNGAPSNQPSSIIGYGLRVRSLVKKDSKTGAVAMAKNRPVYRTDFLEAYTPAAMQQPQR